jgi:hypothetical protein
MDIFSSCTHWFGWRDWLSNWPPLKTKLKSRFMLFLSLILLCFQKHMWDTLGQNRIVCIDLRRKCKHCVEQAKPCSLCLHLATEVFCYTFLKILGKERENCWLFGKFLPSGCNRCAKFLIPNLLLMSAWVCPANWPWWEICSVVILNPVALMILTLPSNPFQLDKVDWISAEQLTHGQLVKG